jgi:hypothetical protein
MFRVNTTKTCSKLPTWIEFTRATIVQHHKIHGLSFMVVIPATLPILLEACRQTKPTCNLRRKQSHWHYNITRINHLFKCYCCIPPLKNLTRTWMEHMKENFKLNFNRRRYNLIRIVSMQKGTISQRAWLVMDQVHVDLLSREDYATVFRLCRLKIRHC